MKGGNKKDLVRRLKEIRVLMLDVDGVMTDGAITFSDRGDEVKSFDVKDGHGIKLLMKSGIDVMIITSRRSKALLRRTEDLGMARSSVFDGVSDKLAVFEGVLKKRGLGPEAIAFVGDDLMDLPVMKRAGFSVAVSDAAREVRASARHVTKRPGGRGAVREVAELILKARGLWQEAIEAYLR